MPNHVINEVIFSGVDDAAQDHIRALVCNGKGTIDFEVLVPSPTNIWRGSVGIQHEKTFPDTHLNWAQKNWGTKWNAYGDPKIISAIATITLTFKTAWNPPYGWLVALFNVTGKSFRHNWLSEGGAPAKIGTWKADGNAWDNWVEVDADEVTQKHLHFLLWGCESFDDVDEEGDDNATT